MIIIYYIFQSLVSIYICYKLGDWENWIKYYPTILFFILSSVVCIVLTYDHPLWLYKPQILNHTFTDLLISITVYPCTIMMFIPHLPKKLPKIILHISIYVAVYTIPELIAVKLGYFTYHNGWNIWYTIIFNYIMFPIIILHYKKPLYAWLIALVSPHILFFLLKIPYNVIR
ncbi:CBO0543 family protein [Clostridium estertheticum]|uniref:CBO0543 family protein n=1 Tax=Clostridium estertheticum TaxID=238834 RepID=UPI0035A11F98